MDFVLPQTLYTPEVLVFQFTLFGTNFLAPDDWVEITLRLGLALLVGAVIGWDREIRGKPAGLRTHMLVSLGSALLILIPIQLGEAQRSSDAISRVIQGIAAGVGFLGAGEILRESQVRTEKVKIRGLTSAAAIWVSAALGIVAGCGLWVSGLIGAFMAWFILSGIKNLEEYALARKNRNR